MQVLLSCKPSRKESALISLILVVFSGALADPHGVQNIQPTAERTLTSRKSLYELFSVVVHHGGPQSGHYTVYRKVRFQEDMDPAVHTEDEDGAGLLHNPEVPEDCRGKLEQPMESDNARGRGSTVWFKVSDTNVRRVDESEVQLAKASLLFYERLMRNT